MSYGQKRRMPVMALSAIKTLTGVLLLTAWIVAGCSSGGGGGSDTDETPPAIVINQPTEQSTYTTNEDFVTIAGTASDNIAVTQVTWESDTGMSGTAEGTDSWQATIDLKEGS